MKGKLILNEQEERGNYFFIGIARYMTIGFKNTFGNEAELIAFTAQTLIYKTYCNNADYFQTFKYLYDGMETTFWCINEGNEIVTFLLPNEY